MLTIAVSKRFKGMLRSRVSGLALCSKKVADLMFGTGDVDKFWNSADGAASQEEDFAPHAGADGT